MGYQKVNQPTSMPTRKMWAVMISSAAVAFARYYISKYFPALDNLEFYVLFENVISFLVIAVSGYMTKEKVNVD